MPFNHLILCWPLLLPSIFPSIRFHTETHKQYEKHSVVWYKFAERNWTVWKYCTVKYAHGVTAFKNLKSNDALWIDSEAFMLKRHIEDRCEIWFLFPDSTPDFILGLLSLTLLQLVHLEVKNNPSLSWNILRNYWAFVFLRKIFFKIADMDFIYMLTFIKLLPLLEIVMQNFWTGKDHSYNLLQYTRTVKNRFYHEVEEDGVHGWDQEPQSYPALIFYLFIIPGIFKESDIWVFLRAWNHWISLTSLCYEDTKIQRESWLAENHIVGRWEYLDSNQCLSISCSRIVQ